MKKIDFKNPKYVIPLICLPFILLLFYAFRIYSFSKPPAAVANGLKSELAPVANGVSEKALEDKLQAFKQRYKNADGYTALGTINPEDPVSDEQSPTDHLTEKRLLDSIQKVLSHPSGTSAAAGVSKNSGLHMPSRQSRQSSPAGQLPEFLSSYLPNEAKASPKQSDPMAIFRQQMALVDSMNKATFSQSSASLTRPKQKRKTVPADTTRTLKVEPADTLPADESTVMPKEKKGAFIQAMVEESLTGFNGSRVTIRLETAIHVGTIQVEKGTRLYAIISSFSAQRVNLSISSIFYQGEILPVNLEVYDLDGLKGIYVPSSTYRELSRELTATAAAGLTMDASSDQNQQIRSLLGRMFQSTTGAVNKLIRSNKAHIRYPTMLYLVNSSHHN